MRNQDTATSIEEAIERARLQRAPVVWFAAAQILAQEDPAEWAAICLAAGFDLIARAEARVVNARAPLAPDTRQGLLTFPEYREVPEVIEVGGALQELGESTLAQYRESTEVLRARVKSYTYPRVSSATMTQAKKELAQRDKLDSRISPLMAGDPEMKMREGFAAFERSQQKPATRQRIEAGKHPKKAPKRRT
jgi:hypothetical protein